MESEFKKGDKVMLKSNADTFELAENEVYTIEEVVYITPFNKDFLILEEIKPRKAFDLDLFTLYSS